MAEEQLDLEGIGQQLYTLEQWKKDNTIFTHHAPHMKGHCPVWSCWDEMEDAADFLSKYGDHNMGFGDSEKEAILDFCDNHGVKPPFWW